MDLLMKSNSAVVADHEMEGSACVVEPVVQFKFPALGGGLEKSIAAISAVFLGRRLYLWSSEALLLLVKEVDALGGTSSEGSSVSGEGSCCLGLGGRPRLGLSATTASSLR